MTAVAARASASARRLQFKNVVFPTDATPVGALRRVRIAAATSQTLIGIGARAKAEDVPGTATPVPSGLLQIS